MLNVAFINPNSESKPFKKVQQIKHIFISELFYLQTYRSSIFNSLVYFGIIHAMHNLCFIIF